MTTSRRHEPVEVALSPGGACVFASEHDRRFDAPWMDQPYVKALYVLRGQGTLDLPDGSQPFTAGDAIVVPPQVRHRLTDRLGRPATLYGACLDPATFAAVAAGDPLALRPGVLSLSQPMSAEVGELFRRLLYEQQADLPGARLRVVGGVVWLLGILQRAGTEEAKPAGEPRGHLMDRVADYVQHLDHAFLQPGTLGQAAASLGMSRRRFTALFREHTGMSWAEYVEHRRITHAQRQLAEGPRPVAAVAFECGYRDLSTFYRAFRRQTGTSPAAAARLGRLQGDRATL